MIGWFGGEPLLALKEIRTLTNEFKKIAKEYNIAYESKIVTNGLSLKKDIYIELVEKLHVGSIEITIDGTEEFHDKRRNTKDKHPTFNIIIKNMQDIFSTELYQKKKCLISVRCNVDKRNYKGVTPLIKYLHGLGFHNSLSYFYLASVYSWGNDAHLKSFSREEFARMEIDWFLDMYKYGFEPGLLPDRVKQTCIVQSKDSEMYDAYGNIFNCTEVSYASVYEKTDYVLGNVKFDSPILPAKQKIHNDWNDKILNNTSNSPCHSCVMLPVCGGACPKQWLEGNISCPTAKYNIKDRLILMFIRANKSPEEFTEILID